MPWKLVHQTWQVYWQIYPPSIEHGCLENFYSNLGRSTCHQSSIDALKTATLNLADLLADLPPSQLSIDALNTATPNLADLPPSQLSIDALNTATPYLADLLPDLPPSMEHRCLEYCYTKLGSTGRSTPQSIVHRCLEYCYIKPGWSTPINGAIDALNTTTLNLADLLADLLLSQLSRRCFEYCNTELGRIYPQSIKHRCLEYHYTTLGRTTGRSTPHQLSIDDLKTSYTNLGRSTCHQSSIDALNTTAKLELLAYLPPLPVNGA